jgi:hypothetical protein
MASVRVKSITKKQLGKAKDKMDWGRVEELLAEKLADRVKINLKIRDMELEADDVDDDGVEDADISLDEINGEVDSRELAFFFINRHFNKIHKVG